MVTALRSVLRGKCAPCFDAAHALCSRHRSAGAFLAGKPNSAVNLTISVSFEQAQPALLIRLISRSESRSILSVRRSIPSDVPTNALTTAAEQSTGVKREFGPPRTANHEGFSQQCDEGRAVALPDCPDRRQRSRKRGRRPDAHQFRRAAIHATSSRQSPAVESSPVAPACSRSTAAFQARQTRCPCRPSAWLGAANPRRQSAGIPDRTKRSRRALLALGSSRSGLPVPRRRTIATEQVVARRFCRGGQTPRPADSCVPLRAMKRQVTIGKRRELCLAAVICRTSLSANHRSSSSRSAIHSPRADRMPRLRAAALPSRAPGKVILSRLSSILSSAATASRSSPSGTTMTSRRAFFCNSAERTASVTIRALRKVGITTEISGA